MRKSHSSQLTSYASLSIPVPNANDIVTDLIIKYGGESSNIERAAEANDILAVKRLLAYGGDSLSAIMGAIKGMHLELVKILIEEARAPLYEALVQSAKKQWWNGFDFILKYGHEIPSILLDEAFLERNLDTVNPGSFD